MGTIVSSGNHPSAAWQCRVKIASTRVKSVSKPSRGGATVSQAGSMTLLDYLPSLRRAAAQRIDPAVWPLRATVDDLGRVCVGEVALTEIADRYGTPCQVVDEADVRARVRRQRRDQPGAEVVFGSAALLSTTVARWVDDERAGLAVGSTSELAVALAAGVDPQRIVARAATFDELSDATAVGVGRIVVDSLTQLALLSCAIRRPQRVLLRVCPEPGPIGFAPGDELAEAARRVTAQPHLVLDGSYGAVGAAIDDGRPVAGQLRRVVEAPLTGGVRLCRVVTVQTHRRAVAMIDARTGCAAGAVASGRTGVTLVLAGRHPMGPNRPTTVVDRTGGTVAADADLPADLHPGDLLAVPGDRCPDAADPVIAVAGGQATAVVRRQTAADLLARDLGGLTPR
jgi:diaminopimelate decarboxylase